MNFPFRSSASAQDVWSCLEKNWNNFFGLTGESPVSLTILVWQIQQNYFHLFTEGSRCKLDLRNQVCLSSLLLIGRFPYI